MDKFLVDSTSTRRDSGKENENEIGKEAGKETGKEEGDGYSPIVLPGPPPKKRTRISQACDFCHNRSVRCRKSIEKPKTCGNCVDFGVLCQYLRPLKKRGGKKQGVLSKDGLFDDETLSGLNNDITKPFTVGGWFGRIVDNNKVKIRDLVEVYFDVVYQRYAFLYKSFLIQYTNTSKLPFLS